VDTQQSASQIVVQVIGEISNKGAPSRKFVQTFVLHPQTNGFFVLNDIFRYLADEEDEPIEDTTDVAPVEPTHTVIPATELEAAPVTELSSTTAVDVELVDQELEEVAKKGSHEETNGHPTAVEDAASVDDAPAAAGTEAEEKAPEPEKLAAEPFIQVQTPKEPAPTPAVPEPKAAPKVAAVPTPAKPAVPKTWAQLASANSASAAAAAAAAAAAPVSSPVANVTQAKASPAVATHTPSTSATPIPTTTPQRQHSPADSNQEGSSGGWQTAGADHSRNKSRSHTGPTLSENGTVRAYVKNVFQSVTADALRAELSKYGELSYFDVSRQKVCIRSIILDFGPLTPY
jgi:Nuclear transport factor 2 (NTF2) domain